ncbi:HEPN domain-containing protein [Azospira sp. APE16]|uniref:HEPN domain-containing protein n=1 Tax=Azospira sp. APE16 TaxID=3394231 RepID=UPI003A4E4D75
MRKISPDDVRDDFRQQLADLNRFHTAGCIAFASETDQSTLTEHSLLAAAVTWEGFVSDMFIAYINRDASRFKQHLANSFNVYIDASSTPKRVFEAFGSLRFPTHLNKADVLALANSMGNNITFPNFGQLEEKACSWLVAAHAAKFTALTVQQKAIINSLIALRNHIAHRSQRSLDAMNDTLAQGSLFPTGIKRLENRFHNVGAWLKSIPVGHNRTRFAIIMNILDDVGATF